MYSAFSRLDHVEECLDDTRFDIKTLRALAGGKMFARGEAYYCEGQVEILGVEPRRVLAQVAGTEDYRTVLTGCGTQIDGECSCPAFEDWGFCKHMVAALTVNAMGDSGEADGAGVLGRIRKHLGAKDVDALVEMIVELAARDPALLRRLDMASATVHADDASGGAQAGAHRGREGEAPVAPFRPARTSIRARRQR